MGITMTSKLLFLGSFLLFGCTTVSVTPIDSEGTKKVGKVDGIPFYRPKPYLLVAEMNKDCQAKFDVKINNQNLTIQGQDDSQTNDSEPPIEKALSNTSFEFAGNENGFFAKLIYLPDYAHGYALSINSWWRIFGIAEVSPTLQDGWMLVNLNEKTDSQTPETLNSIASIVAAARSGTPPTPSETPINNFSAQLNSTQATEGTDGQKIIIKSQPSDCSLLNFKLYEFSLPISPQEFTHHLKLIQNN
jgi:hypothetical protein